MTDVASQPNQQQNQDQQQQQQQRNQEGDSAVGDNNSQQLHEGYNRYGAFGGENFHGNNLTLKNADKWLREAGIFSSGKGLSTGDTAVVYKQIVGNDGHAMSFEQFTQFLHQLAERNAAASDRNATDTYNEMMGKLSQHGNPELHDTTKPLEEMDVVQRLTDPAGFTGVQKERFNADGTGKGIAESSADYSDRNVKEDDGYVAGYKDKDTFDQKH